MTTVMMASDARVQPTLTEALFMRCLTQPTKPKPPPMKTTSTTA